MKFETHVIYRGQVTYIVEANSEEEAQGIAKEKYSACEPSTIPSNDWETVERIGTIAFYG